MRFRDAAALAFTSLCSSAAKTLLTILGLGVGTAAVLTVQALAAAGEVQVELEIARLGVDRVWITAAEDGELLTAESAFLVSRSMEVPVCAGAHTLGIAALDGHSVPIQIAGYSEGMADVHGAVLADGRHFNAEDFSRGRSVCIVDGALADSLGGDVLGRRLAVGGRRFLVVGVAENLPVQGTPTGTGMMALPLATFCDTFGGSVQELTIAVPPGQSAGDISAEALRLLGEAEYRADSLENEIDAARQIVRIFVMVLACVAAVCMLTGAIGVMNVLLVSVRERRREIGLIKALGGTSVQVGLLFLLEAAGYATLGGVLGLGLGGVMIRLFGGWIGVEASMQAGEALTVMAAASALGVVFGVAPALRAAGMQVVDALRCE